MLFVLEHLMNINLYQHHDFINKKGIDYFLIHIYYYYVSRHFL